MREILIEVEEVSLPRTMQLLNWELEVVDGDEIVFAGVGDIEEIPAGDQVAVFGRSAGGQYLYVLEIDTTGAVNVLYPRSSADLAPAGQLRIPQHGWFTMPSNGAIRVAAATSPVAPEEWP